jgi:hypothetical protein
VADRQVNLIRKDRHGNITALCNPDEKWSPREKEDAIRDIEDKIHTYYVQWPEGYRTDIGVIKGPTGKYLHTDKDNTPRNNLDDLPVC